MITNFFKSLEDPRHPVFGVTYWGLKKTGLVTDPNNLYQTIKGLFLISIFALFVVTQLIELYIVRFNVELVIINLKFTFIFIVALTKAITFKVWNKQWLALINYVTAANMEESANTEDKAVILENYRSKIRFVLNLLWFVALSTIPLSCNVVPLIKYIISETYREDLSSGTEQLPHISSAWVPFNKNTLPGYFTNLLLQICMTVLFGAFLLMYDSTALSVLIFFDGKLDVIKQDCKDMLGFDGKTVTDEMAVENIRQIHRRFKLLREYTILYDSLVSPVMFLYVVICSLMLSTSTIQLSYITHTGEIIVMVEYILAELTELFLICWFCNEVQYKSRTVSLGVYESQWWQASPQQRKNAALLAVMMNCEMEFTAGPFTNLSVETFIAIVKGAYSYYTLFT